MNPLTNVKNITKLNETELATGSIHKKSWHDMYKESAWIFIGGLPYDLTEGDILAVFSQYGEIVNLNLVRDKKTGKSKGYGFLCYSNQKSTVLAVDNFNGMKLCSRTIRVDHVANYKPPKEDDRDDEITRKLKSEGCAPKLAQAKDKSGVQMPVRKKKSKKEKKEKKKKSNSDERDSEGETVEIKAEKHDPGYDKYDTSSNKTSHTIKSKYREESYNKSIGESSKTHENHRSKVDEKHSKSRNRDGKLENNRTDEDKLIKNIKRERDISQHKEYLRNSVEHVRSSKLLKRRRSSSSSDSDVRSKNRTSDSMRKRKDSSSSGSDSSSSSESSSEEEKDKDKPRKDEYRTYKDKQSHLEKNRHRHYYNSEDSNYSSSKSRHYGEAEKYSENKNKSKHRSDDDDLTDRRNSHYHKSKRDRR